MQRARSGIGSTIASDPATAGSDRYDFVLAERERRERERVEGSGGRRKKAFKRVEPPSEVFEDEQWPGSY